MRKSKTISVQLLLGIIFGILGASFIFVGVILKLMMPLIIENGYNRGDVTILPLIFFGIGIAFAVPVSVLLATNSLKNKKRAYLLESGRAITAHVDSIDMNYHVEVNKAHPYVIKCSYQDPVTMEVHRFKSENYFGNLDYYKDNDIRVYIDGNDYSYYIVDVDESKIK